MAFVQNPEAKMTPVTPHKDTYLYCPFSLISF